jgi:hypothetical protein
LPDAAATSLPSDAPLPYRRGWRAPWRRQWGTFNDGHSRLSCLARRIGQELLEEYIASTPIARRRIRAAAEYLALAEKTRRDVGVDPKATRRAASQLERVAEAKLVLVERRSARPAPTSGSELLDRLARERGRE